MEHSEEEYIPQDRWRSEVRKLLEQTMLARFAPAGLIVDHRNEIQYFHGNTSPYLRPPRGEPRFAILEMAIPELRSTLSTGLNKTRAEKRQVVYRDVELRGNGHKDVDISFIPLSSRSTRWDLLLVTFSEKAREVSEELEGSGSSTDSRLADLEQELFSTRQDLQATIEELETTNEELKSSNEELQANNEELQSTNEELDTSREELQSTNEELETLNTELQRKNQELESINDDIRNMFANSNVSTVILDTELRVKRFTPMVTALFNLIDKDIGRKLTDISTNLVEYDTLEQDFRGVLNDLNQREREVRCRGGEWMIVRISPYRSGGNVIEGVVITFNDVTELKQKQQEAEEAKLQAEAVLETTRQPLLVLDSDLNVVTANHAFYETFQVAKKETQGRRVYSLGNNQWDIPELRTLLEEIIPESSSFRDYEVEHEFPGLGRRKMLLDARRIDRGEDKPYQVLVGFEERRAKGEDG